MFSLVFFFKILLIYLRERETELAREGGVEREGEADSPLSREPNALHPRTLGS